MHCGFLHLACCLLLAIEASALSVSFDDPSPPAPPLVMNPGDSHILAWSVDPPGATVDPVRPSGFIGDLISTGPDTAGKGTLRVVLPANATPGTFSLKLRAQAASATATSPAQSLRINSPPVFARLSGGSAPSIKAGVGSVTITEDCDDVVLTLTFTDSDDQGDTPMLGAVQAWDTRFDRADLSRIGTHAFRLTVHPVQDRFTTASTPAPVTLLISDSEQGRLPVTINVAILPVNDPPSIRPPQDPDPGCVYLTDSDQGAAVGDGVTLFEDLDSLDDSTATTTLIKTYDYNGTPVHHYLHWFFTVVDGVDGGDLLALAAPDDAWLVADGDILFQPAGGKMTKVATWSRATGFTTANRSDQIYIALATTDANLLKQVASRVAALVRYRWLLGAPPVPPGGDPWRRQVDITVEEPVGKVWDRQTHPLRRVVTILADNAVPAMHDVQLRCSPRESTPLNLDWTDDDASRATFTITDILPEGAGRFYEDGDPATSILGFTYAERDLIRFQHLDPDVATITATVTMDDHDPRGPGRASCTVEIIIVPDKPQLAFLSDPILQATIDEGGALSWRLRFTHPVPTPPRLSAYPGLGELSHDLSIDGDASQWELTWWSNRSDAQMGFVACVITATTDDPSVASDHREASQSVLIRLRQPDGSGPSAVHAPGVGN